MAIAVDASSPALALGTSSASITTASFNPPACVLVACLVGNGNTSTSTTTFSVSNNGTALTWNLINIRNKGDASSQGGAAAIYYAILPSSRTGMTVTGSVVGAIADCSLKVYCVTGADTSNPVGGISEGSTTTRSNTVNGGTIAVTGSLGFVCCSDFSGAAVACTSTDLTKVDGQSFGMHAFMGYKTLGSAGGTPTAQFTLSDSSPQANWVYAEIKIQTSQTFTQNCAGSSTPSGALTGGKAVTKGALTASSTPGATIASKTSAKATQTGSSTPTGAVIKAVTKDKRTGSSTPSGIVTPTRVVLLPTKTGSSAPGPGLIRPLSTTRNQAGSITPSSLLSRAITKTNRTGSITPSGAAPPAHIYNRPAGGSTTPSGLLRRMPIKNSAGKGSITPSGIVGPKEITYLLTSSLAPSGHMVPVRQSATAMWVGPSKAVPAGKILYSNVSWEEVYVPPGSQIIVETSVNNGASWEVATNGRAVPNLAPGKDVVKAIMYRVKLIRLNGTSPKPIFDKLYIDIDTNTSHDELVPCGSFLITDTTITDSGEGVVIQLDGVDLSLRVRENAWESVRTFPAGTNMGEVIRQVILDRDPEAKFDFASTQMVAPATLTFGANAQNDPLADVQKCAAFCGNELFMDYRGYYVFQPQPDPEIDPVVRTFSDRANPTMTKVMRRLTRTESFNYIVVSGESSGNDSNGNPIVPVSASAADNDPRSPTYYLGVGGKRVKRFVSKLVTSVGDALTMAQGYLLKLKGAGETIEISCVPDPSMLEGDTVAVDRSTAGLNANYLVDAFQINFGVGQDMTWAGRRQKLDNSQASGGGVGGLDGDTGGGGGSNPVPRTYTTPGECHKIGTNGNLNHFKLQTAFTGDSAITEKSQAQIGGGYSQSPEYCMSADKTAVQMRVNLNAPTTSGSSNPRTEYREMDSNGTGTTGWSFGNGHGVQVSLRWTKLPNSLKRCSGIQIHDASDDVLQFKTEIVSGTLKYGYNKNGGSFVALGNYTEGDWLTARIMTTGSSTLNIIHKAGTDPTLAGATTTSVTGVTHSGNCYFKVGTYPQSTGSESSSDYASAEFKKLGLYHPGYPDPVYDSDTIGGGGDTTSFTVAFGACINANASSAGSLTHIKNAGPDYFAILGDFWYKDGATPDWVADWNRQTGYSNFAALISALPNPLIVGVSDHDFGYNNNSTGADNPSRTAAFNTAYRTKWGSSGAGVQGATLPANGIYRTWVVGRVRFILLDMLTFKSSLSATDNSSKTMLGSTQKAWYKNLLSTSSEPLIVVFGDGQIPGPKEAGQDEWRGYDTERRELQSALNACPATVIYANGDTHSLATGTNQFGYDKCWQSAPLHNTTKVKAGGEGYEQQYPDNAHESDTVVSELYAIMTFTDDGSSITATYEGYEGTEVRITDTITA